MSPSPSRPAAGSRSSRSPGADGGGSVALSSEGPLIHLALRRERSRNAISPQVLGELEDALSTVERTRDAKVLVLTGEGRVFSVGADLAVLDLLPPEEALAFFDRGRALLRQLRGLDVLTLAAVNGLALGGGFELALACDVRWAHARAAFGFPECRLGLIPGWDGIRSLCRLLPGSRALELLTGGEYLSARAAHALGLVSRICEGTDFAGEVRAAVEGLAARDARALRAVKALARAAGEDAWSAAEASALRELWTARRGAGPDRPAGR